jgi:transcriptional regulator with AAA-type ATPase domain
MPRTSAAGTLTSLLDKSTRPIYVVNDHRRVIYCNEALAAWLDLKRERIVGRNVEYHSEPPGTTSQGRDNSPLSGLCPPPHALVGMPCQGTISSMARDGRLAHRRAEFVPLGTPPTEELSRRGLATSEKAHTAVLVLLAADDLLPQQVAVELSGEPAPDEMHRAIRQFRRGQAGQYALHSLLGDSSAMRKVRAQVTAAAASGANVLVFGPAGSGRGHVARAIHYQSAADPVPKFIPIQCEVVSEELLRRALDALRTSVGVPRHPPTLLLEHLEALSAPHQSQLLAVIRQNAWRMRIIATCSRHRAPGDRLRSPRRRRRAVAESASARTESLAPNDDLADGTRSVPATIDPTLIDAVSTITIRIPKLVDRLEDLPILAHSFLESCNVGSDKQVGSIRPDALDQLALHSWPGELDELQEIIAAAHGATTSHEITPADLPAVAHHASQAASRPRRRPERIVLDELLTSIEKEIIIRAMAQAGGNKSGAAELLGMTRPRLYRRLVQLGLVSEAPPEPEREEPEFVEQDPAEDAP